MANTLGNIEDEVIRRLAISTSLAFYTEDIVDDWINNAYKWAAAYKKWPFTEGRVSTTYSSSTEEYTYPEGWKTDSIRLLQVGGKRMRKINFNDYQTYKEKYENGQERVFSDFGRTYFINTNADVSGTITAYGQYTPADIDATDKDAKTVFSDNDQEGNEAIVYEVMSYAYAREKKTQESLLLHQRAMAILEELYKRYQDEQFGYHSNNDDGMFERFDVLEGDYFDDVVKRNRWF